MLNNFGKASDGLYRCGQPDQKGIADLADIGIRNVFKLNSESPQEKDWCLANKVILWSYQIPTLTNSVETTKMLAKKLRDIITTEGKTVVHCEHGRDRTGLIIGAYRLIYDKVSLQVAQAERAAYGVTGFYSIFDTEITVVLAQIANGS